MQKSMVMITFNFVDQKKNFYENFVQRITIFC